MSIFPSRINRQEKGPFLRCWTYRSQRAPRQPDPDASISAPPLYPGGLWSSPGTDVLSIQTIRPFSAEMASRGTWSPITSSPWRSLITLASTWTGNKIFFPSAATATTKFTTGPGRMSAACLQSFFCLGNRQSAEFLAGRLHWRNYTGSMKRNSARFSKLPHKTGATGSYLSSPDKPGLAASAHLPPKRGQTSRYLSQTSSRFYRAAPILPRNLHPPSPLRLGYPLAHGANNRHVPLPIH